LGTEQYSVVQCSTVQYSAVQCSTVQCSTVQYSAVQCSTVQYLRPYKLNFFKKKKTLVSEEGTDLPILCIN
jgi:hypothetical protein